MIHDNFWFGIPSRGRPEQVKKIFSITKTRDITWYVPINQAEIYRAEGATVQAVNYKTLPQKRNVILRDAWHNNLDCVMMDDDLKSIKLAQSKTEEITIAFSEMLSILRHNLYERPTLRLAGIPQIAKLFYYNPKNPFSYTNFIVSNIYYIRKCDLLFDERLAVKSDYDYTLQHIERYGGALRCNQILATFEHWSNRGGLAYRNHDLNQFCIRILKEKWGHHVRDNPKRYGEILLNVRSR